MRRNALPLLVSVLLLPFLVAATPATSPAAVLGERPPAVAAELARELATLEDGARLDVIVTAWDAAGLAAVEEVGATPHRLRMLPIAFAQLTAEQVTALSGDRRIRSLWNDEQHELFLDEGTAMVGADRVAQDLGVDGDGVIVAVIDTGIDTTHEDLDDGKVVGNFLVADQPFSGDLTLIEAEDTDDHGHGTHVASTVAGLDDDGGNLMDGVAPGASLLGYSINVNGSVLTSAAIIAFDDLLVRKAAGEPIVAASNSWGGGDGTYAADDPLAVSTRALFEGGIVPVFAAGNSGPGLETASNQCTIPWTFCVGAITKGRTLAGFSSRGRTPDATTETRPDGVTTPIQGGNHDVALGQAYEVGVYRPNVSAPGVDIEAACAKLACGTPHGYQLMSGTSMATPHVSGVIALVQSARLAAGQELSSADTVTRLVEGTANRLPGYELWEAGTGEVDALEATTIASEPVSDAELDIPVANAGATTVAGGEPSSRSFSGVVLPNGWNTGIGYVEEFEVSGAAGGFTALLEWANPAENIYLNLYAPGLEPGVDSPTAQSAGLLEGNFPYTRGYRDLEVHFPEPGTWTFEVLGRVNTVSEVTVTITERPLERPDVTIDEVSDDRVAGSTDAASLTAPASDGVTRPAVPGTAEPVTFAGEPTIHYLHSVAGAADGLGDAMTDGTPFATFDTTAPTGPVSKVSEVTMFFAPDFAGDFFTAYWRGQVDGAIAGDVTLDAYLSTPTGAVITTNMTATLFSTAPDAHGTTSTEGAEVEVLGQATTEAQIGVTPGPVSITVPGVVTSDLTGRDVIIQLTSTYIDTGHVQVWHDSTIHPSSLTIPVLQGEAGAGAVGVPGGLAVTDGIGGGATLSWDAVDGATGYVVESSTDPTDGWDGVEVASGTTFEDAGAPVRTATYYRVRAVDADGNESPASAIAYATPIDDAPEVEVQFGLGPWERATLAEDGTWVFERVAGTDETCSSPGGGPDRERPDRGNGNGGNGKGGPPVSCETTVTYDALPAGDVQARASRWFTTSPVASAAR